KKQSFTVEVQVPANIGGGISTSTGVTVTSRGDSLISDQVQLTTTSKSVHAVTLTPGTNVKTTPGSSVTYTLKLTNNGNVSESFDVEITGSNWAAAADADPIGPIAAGASAELHVTVQVPAGETSGSSDTATVTVKSFAGSAQASATLVTVVDTVFGTMITPEAEAKSADPGQSVTFTLTVANAGNAPDTFDLSAEVSKNLWQTTLSTAVVGPLAAGAQDDVNVTV